MPDSPLDQTERWMRGEGYWLEGPGAAFAAREGFSIAPPKPPVDADEDDATESPDRGRSGVS